MTLILSLLDSPFSASDVFLNCSAQNSCRRETKPSSLKMTTLLFPLNLCSVTHWWGAFQSCSLPVLTSLPIIQAASQTSDANSTRLLCKRTLINHQLNQTIYCVISRQLVNTSQILLTAVTAFLSSHIPAFQYTTATVFLALSSPVRHGSG